MRDFHFLEPLSDCTIMFLVNGSANGCKNIIVYLEGSLGNAGMQAPNFEIDVIELFLNLHKTLYQALHFLIFSIKSPIDLQANYNSKQRLQRVLLIKVCINELLSCYPNSCSLLLDKYPFQARMNMSFFGEVVFFYILKLNYQYFWSFGKLIIIFCLICAE